MNSHGPEGMIFAGRYRVVRLIGRGGMANVYLASDITSNMNVAIKILKPEFSSDEEFIRRFDTEAKAVSSLSHANIVKVLGVGHDNGFRYIIQEYVDGITVKELINQNGHLDWKVAVPIAIQVGLALEYAHRNGVVHRDIKPQNILISRNKIAKITDFGIARASTSNTITMNSGGALGTVHYFSPEQARGGNIGPSSDIYSIGVMIFEMVTGRVPFDGDSNVAVAVKHLQEKPPLASSFVLGIPSGLDSIILKCMQKLPEKRYLSMRQMVEELDSLLVDPNGVYGVISNSASPNEEEINVSFRQDPDYGKIKEFESSVESRRHSRFRDNIVLILIIVAIVGVLIGISTLIVKTLGNSMKMELNSDYTVKNYVGWTSSEAEDELTGNNILYEIQRVVRDDYAPDIVIAQSIEEGEVISSNSSVSRLVLTVSAAPDAIILADYAGLSFSDAYSTLSSQGLSVSIRPESNADVAPELVLRTEPPASTPVMPGDTVVIIYAIEPTSSVIPDIIEMNLEEARLALEEEGIAISTIEGVPEVLALPETQQFVLFCSPGACVTVPRRSSIRIIVGTSEDVARGGTPTPTPASISVIVGVRGEGGYVSGGGEFAPNTSTTLTATPSAGYLFDHWEDAYGNYISSQMSLSVVVTEASHTFTAVFILAPTAPPTNTPVVPTTTPSVTPSITAIPTSS
ncbi:MAG: Stk1 family PASTA domain-containing Ser/Thr kinase [Saccharofermentanales bacterium]